MEEGTKLEVTGGIFDSRVGTSVVRVFGEGFRPGNGVTFSGIETGELTLHAAHGHLFIVKEAGHQWYWNQYQGTRYEPAKFHVFRVISLGDPKRLEYLGDFYVKQQEVSDASKQETPEASTEVEA